MLKNLYVKSFIIIDELNLDFYHGMNVLTGETGAGKSIIIDAVGQLMGNRGNVSFIQKGAKKAVIEGIFDNPNTDAMNKLLDELHIENEETITICKELLINGKSNIRINGHNSSIRALKQIAPLLMDIHSQFETQSTFNTSNHIHLLDIYSNIPDLLDQYNNAYISYTDSLKELEYVKEQELSDEQLEYLESQLEDIDAYYCTDDELSELESELKILKDYEKLNEAITGFDQHMNDSMGVLSSLKESIDMIRIIKDYEEFENDYDSIYDTYYTLYDQYDSIISTFKSFHFDEYRFNELQDQLFNISRLKRKYGLSMERILESRNDIETKIKLIKNRDSYIIELENQLEANKNKCLELANQIHKQREQSAKTLTKEIEKELIHLYLENVKIRIDISNTTLNKNGADDVQFMVAINKGQQFSLLNDSASGGEISRLMLAIKIILNKVNPVETMIFDEIDTGVSGKVASAIGKRIASLGESTQIICITHLPQVAVNADYHYEIKKSDYNDTTISTVKLLDDEERVYEIAKMLSNEKITEEALNNARTLLNNI